MFLTESVELFEKIRQAFQASRLLFSREGASPFDVRHEQENDHPFPVEVVTSVGSNNEPFAKTTEWSAVPGVVIALDECADV
jgi:hypothetical protein